MELRTEQCNTTQSLFMVCEDPLRTHQHIILTSNHSLNDLIIPDVVAYFTSSEAFDKKRIIF